MSMLQQDPTQLEGWEMVLLRAAHAMSLTKPQYQLISDRYDQLQRILSVSDHPLLQGAHIFVQGSIRLKTTIKPTSGAEGEMATIDADAVVWLPNASAADAAQVLLAIEDRFEDGTRVDEPIHPLRRGIRIIYSDENPGFHIDVTPAWSSASNHASNGEGALQVPDRETGWKASSPIPYANWLEKTAEQKISLVGLAELAKRHVVLDEASQDPIPGYDEYIDANPLRATIKLLKRHRDEWAIREDKVAVRPISALLTTLAAQAYLEVARRSQQGQRYRPIEAIIAIVDGMSEFIRPGAYGYEVCNPEDCDENFAEKWNRRGGEGEAYRSAFYEWHAAAKRDIRLGLMDHGSANAFADAMYERFGVGKSIVEAVTRDLPGNWTLPGRAPGLTGNAARLSAFAGGTAASDASQASIRPVNRLG